MPEVPFDIEAFAAITLRDIAAWHEAGHATAAALLGVAFKGARLGAYDTGSVFGFASATPRFPKWQLKHDVITMAGPRAEYNWHPAGRSPESQAGWAEDIAYFSGDDDRKTLAWSLADQLLTPHAENVMLVKEMLLDKPVVTAAEIRAVVPRIDIRAWPQG